MREPFLSAWLTIRKDVLATRGILAIWGVVLSLPLLLAATGWNDPTWETRMFHQNEWLPGLLLLMFVIVLTLLPSAIILTDSRARQERFLNSRPLEPFGVRLGKILYLGLLLVLPVLFQEVLLGKLQGVAAPVSILMQRPLIVAGWVSLVAAVAALAPTGYRLILAWAVIFAASAGILSFLNQFPKAHPGIEWFLQAESLLVVLIPQVGLALAIATGVLTRKHLLSSCVILSLVASLIICFTPWRGLTKEAANQASITADWTAWKETHEDRWAVDTIDTNGSALNATVRMRSLSEPPDWNIHWRARQGFLTSDQGSTELRSLNEPIITNAQPRWGRHRLSSMLRRELNSDIIVTGPLRHGPNLSIVWHKALDSADRKEPRQITWDLEANIHTWRLIADLPLAIGNQVEDKGRRWTIQGINDRRMQREYDWTIGLHCQLAWGPFQAASPEFVYLLYMPDTKLAVELKGAYGGQEPLDPRASFSAMKDQWLLLRDPQGSGVLSEIPEGAHLLICEAVYQGQILDQWQSPPLILADQQPRHRVIHHTRSIADLSEEALASALRALDPPALHAEPSEFRPYLAEILALLPRMNPPAAMITQLARYAPTQAELLFQALRGSHERQHRFLTQVLIQGLLDSQKDAALQELKHQLALTEVITARGWEVDAKETLLAHLECGQHSWRSISALVSLEDPSILPALLDAIDYDPNYARNLALAPAYRDAVAKRWAALIRARDGEASLESGYADLVGAGFAWGDRLALQEVLRLRRATDSNSHERNYWYNTGSDHIHPGGSNALETHALDDFQWNRLTRRFELKP